jgi:putative FmdB family regulatory protein
MPIYEYKCKKCHHGFEQLQKITDKPLHTCPKCKKKQLVKLISNTSFQLKGSGWYVTEKKDPEKSKAKTEEKTKDTKNKKIEDNK